MTSLLLLEALLLKGKIGDMDSSGRNSLQYVDYNWYLYKLASSSTFVHY